MTFTRRLAVVAVALAAAAPLRAEPLELFSAADRLAAGAPQDLLVRVTVSPRLFQAPTGEVLVLQLPGIERSEWTLGPVERNGDGAYERRAIAKAGGGSARFVQRAEGVAAEWHTAAGGFRLGYANGTQWVVPAGRDVAAMAGQRLPQVFVYPGSDGGSRRAGGIAGTGDRAPAEAAWPAELNVVGLADVGPQAEVRLNLPGADFRVVHEATHATDGGSATFVGHLAEHGRDYRVVLTYGPAGSTGTIMTPKGEFNLAAADGRTWLVDVQASGLKSGDDATQCAVAESPAAAGVTAVAAAETRAGSAIAATLPAATIDVLVLYTPGMVTRYGSVAAVENRIDFLLGLANQAYRDSGMPMQLRRVSADQVSYPDTTTSSSALTALRSGSDPAFAGVAARRTALGADLVTLLRPFYMQAQGPGVCGIGYVGGYNGAPIAQYAGYAFSVVSDGTDVMRTGYYCQDVTLAHEFGHNMGAMHDRANAGGGTGAYPYAFGYGRSGSFGTVMSYIQPRIPKFSNPLDLSCGGGFACGVAETDLANSADNAKALTNTREGVAAFRTTSVGASLTIAGVVSLNGAALANVTVSGTGASCTPSGTNGAYACTVAAGWSGTLTPVRAGYGFTPGSRSYTALSASQAAQNFAAAQTALSLSGRVTINRRQVPGVTISGAACSVTDSAGYYRCSVPYGWSGTLQPIANATFTPAIRTLANVTYDRSGLNFSGTAAAKTSVPAR
jgi:hypothetical protein